MTRLLRNQRWRMATVAGLAAAMTAGCDDGAGLTLLSPEIDTAPEAGTSLEFGETVFGVDGPADPFFLRVVNLGDGPLNLNRIEVEGAGADQYRVSSAPDRLAPGGEAEVVTRFEPTVTGTATAELVVRSNDPDEPELRWPLLGSARDPCVLDLGPSHQVFGLNEQRDVTILAESSRDCLITQVQVDRSTFEVELPAELPFVVRAGQTETVRVRHIGVPLTEGRTVRQLTVRESEGTSAAVSLEGEVALARCLEFFPDRLVYPVTPVGEVGVQYVSAVNSGCDEPAQIVDAVVTTGAYAYSAAGAYPMTIEPGQQVNIPVEYRPLLSTGDGGRLILLTNDAATPRHLVTLFGTAAEPQLEIWPRRVDFGAVAYRNPRGPEMRSECSSASRIVQLYSVGGSAVVLSDVYVDPSSDGLFQISSVTVNGQPVDFSQSFQVPRNTEMRIELVFAPTRTNPALHEGTLVFEHNVGDGRTEVELLGTGADDGQAEDVFRQLPGPKADILWVIDDSGSMFDEQARLIDNLSQFTGFADSLNSDYQMGVVTTDGASSNAGKFQRCFPAPSIVGSSYGTPEERQAAFECMFDVGLNGSGDERGIAAAKRALERALDENLDPNPNRGFIRDDAQLAVVVVSDEDDSSAIPPDIAKQFFLSLKGRRNPERVRFHSIIYPTDTREGCEENLFGTPGYRYRRLTRETNGLYFNICLDDWSPILLNLGIDTFNPLDGWELSREADPATISVTVDAVPVLEDPTNGWSYEPAYNSVRFNGTSLPGPGAEVRIRYQGLCRP